MAKNYTYARKKKKKKGATVLKLGMYIQLDSGCNMGWVPPGYTSSSWYVKLNMPIMV